MVRSVYSHPLFRDYYLLIVFPVSDLEADQKLCWEEIENARMYQTLEFAKEVKVKIELVKEQATTVDEELKAVSLTLTEFKAVQTGGKRQEAMRKEIHRLRRLQTQRKAEIESLEVCSWHVHFSFSL
jgi:hypothetical protein